MTEVLRLPDVKPPCSTCRGIYPGIFLGWLSAPQILVLNAPSRRGGSVAQFGIRVVEMQMKERAQMDTATVLTLDKQEPRGCRWIEGDPRDEGWTFCQRPVVGRERSWCAKHRDLVFRTIEERRAA